MPLPEPEYLTLSEAATRIAAKCNVSEREAQDGLIRALREPQDWLPEGGIYWYSGRSERPEYMNWAKVAIDWEKSTFSWWERSTRYEYLDILVSRINLDMWILRGERLSQIGGARAEAPAVASDELTGPWPAADTEAAQPTIEQYKTGLPGRPTIAHLIVEEFRGRVKSGQCKNTLAAEARALRDWAAAEHGLAPTPSPRAIENQIRGEYRANVRIK
jgi:hypothetical protein